MILSGGKNEKPKNKNSFFLRSGGEGIILSFILISLLILASCQNKPIIYPGITTPPVVTSNPKAEAAADAIEYLRSDSFWNRVAKSISAQDQTLTVDTTVTTSDTQNLSMNRISVAKPSGTRAETVRYQIVMRITFTKFTDGTVSIPAGSIVATMTTDEVPDSETDVKISDYSITTTNVAFSNQSSSGVVSITGAEGTTKTTVKLSDDKTKVVTANDIKLDVIAESKAMDISNLETIFGYQLLLHSMISMEISMVIIIQSHIRTQLKKPANSYTAQMMHSQQDYQLILH